ncbi:small integral membrane protein 1 [Onychostoma macrolepis]|uniref:small integral membrane protein 1 n=1 Tax=Onychostoma macrolepis TaxID=369639 RepID=UPI00272BE64C|nr:small integral membrane protein 1 [Onychostoma macrolepis]XP_058640253.1 small integral membrane protein 1 [Onychostoma macrolepis]XP_058640254.1 small integral membrane protein 1 [Onychostoma macrolepis]XP_058640255.1 small integral membrane protein 1 [Onychostoma macrolepis]
MDMNMQVPHSQSRLIGLCNRLCIGRLGIAMKVTVSMTVMVVIYIVGYITGFYVYRC